MHARADRPGAIHARLAPRRAASIHISIHAQALAPACVLWYKAKPSPLVHDNQAGIALTPPTSVECRSAVARSAAQRRCIHSFTRVHAKHRRADPLCSHHVAIVLAQGAEQSLVTGSLLASMPSWHVVIVRWACRTCSAVHAAGVLLVATQVRSKAMGPCMIPLPTHFHRALRACRVGMHTHPRGPPFTCNACVACWPLYRRALSLFAQLLQGP